MPDLNSALADNRDAINQLIAIAEQSGAGWTTPRAEGKWSPSQLVEHIALSLEDAATVVSGGPSSFGSLPAFLRPLLRRFFFTRVLKTGTFPKSRTSTALNPIAGPASPTEARVRLEGALVKFEEACRACAVRGGSVKTMTFGEVSLVDYAQFLAIHTRHHTRQLPQAA